MGKVAKKFTSGWYITWFTIVYILLIFPAWELVQNYRRTQLGNSTALTFSQYVIQRAKEQSGFFKMFILAFPILIFCVSLWLVLHLEGFCHTIYVEKLCEISKEL